MDMKDQSVSPSDPFRRTISSQIFECVLVAMRNGFDWSLSTRSITMFRLLGQAT